MLKHLIIFILLITSAHSQEIDYERLSDDELVKVLEKQQNDMIAKGATPNDMFDYFVVGNDDYIQSRLDYYKFLVHTKYVADMFIQMKTKEGTLEDNDLEIAKNIKNKKQTYAEYLEQKKTREAKERWENSTQNGILKLVVTNLETFSEEEQKRYNGLILLLNRDEYFTAFKITDGKTSKIILPERVKE